MKAYVAMYDAAIVLEESLKGLRELDEAPLQPPPSTGRSRRAARERARSVLYGDAPVSDDATRAPVDQLALVPCGRAVPPPQSAQRQPCLAIFDSVLF